MSDDNTVDFHPDWDGRTPGSSVPTTAPAAATEKDGVSVQPLWCLSLPIQQQSVLLLGARGPDGIAKAHPCKKIQRAYRATVLLAARYGRSLDWGEKADTFMCLSEFSDDEKWQAIINDFFLHADDLPHHFYMHLIHGAEILGYKHPDPRFRQRWSDFYFRCVTDFHLFAESESRLDERLSDWNREHWDRRASLISSRSTESVASGEKENPPAPRPMEQQQRDL